MQSLAVKLKLIQCNQITQLELLTYINLPPNGLYPFEFKKSKIL